MTKLNLKVDLWYFEIQAIANALSRDIIYLNNTKELPELLVAIRTYEKIHEAFDNKWSDWLITNSEVQKIINSHK